jgi:succinate-semialdehyde dehydrogenase/glutarate-semialdehyde dehydrogenase
VEAAARIGAVSRTQNAGQSFFAAKRFIVVESAAERFLAAFEARLKALVVGDPLDPRTEVGPLGRADLRDILHRQVCVSVAMGADLRLGGSIPPGPGCFYPVTLLVGVRPGMPAWDEETFGPVAAVRVVADAEEAVAAANQTQYGLGATIFTGEALRANELAARIEAGIVYVNAQLKVDARLPFGGQKGSGHGRELSWHGLREFVNTKAVWVA